MCVWVCLFGGGGGVSKAGQGSGGRVVLRSGTEQRRGGGGMCMVVSGPRVRGREALWVSLTGQETLLRACIQVEAAL